jgi:hypothetical protein
VSETHSRRFKRRELSGADEDAQKEPNVDQGERLVLSQAVLFVHKHAGLLGMNEEMKPGW